MVSLLLKTGGPIALLALLQCIFGFLGIRQLVVAITDLFPSDKPTPKWIACFVILFLSSPITPMPIYFATLWDDSWLIILLLWSVALLLEFAREKKLVGARNNHRKVFLLIIPIAAVMLARPNSPIMYPPLILVFTSILRRQSFSRKFIFALALCPLMLYLFANIFYYAVVGVKHVHHERISLTLDLASMLTYNPIICQTLSLLSCKLIQEKFPPEFIAGNGAIDHTLGQGSNIPEPGFVELAASPFLVQDLWLAATHYPGTFGKVKVLNFLDYIRPRDQYYYQSFIHPNNFNLAFSPQLEPVRIWYFLLLNRVYRHPVLKYISFVHLPWILINLAGIIFWFLFARKSKKLTLIVMILTISTVYYLSYLLALTASEFRFMYPSTLLTQVIIITSIILGIENRLRRISASI